MSFKALNQGGRERNGRWESEGVLGERVRSVWGA